MATLAEVIRLRKDGLRRLQKASLNLDAAQEKVEREVKRLIQRKRSVPESADMERVLTFIGGVSSALDAMAQISADLKDLYGR